jgi:uncharacterized protein YqeY
MTILMNKIREQQLQARKNGHACAALFTTLLGEAMKVGKDNGNRETTDAEVTAIVKKFIKNIDETIAVLSPADTHRISILQDEKSWLQPLLPQYMSEDQLKAFVKARISEGMNNMGAVMKALKDAHDGQYEGAMASVITRSLLGAVKSS